MKFILPLRSLLSSPPISDSKTPPESDDSVRESKDAAARFFDDGGAGPGSAAQRGRAGRSGYARRGSPAPLRPAQVRRHGRRQDQGHGSHSTGGGPVHRGRRRGGVPFSGHLPFGHRDLEGQLRGVTIDNVHATGAILTSSVTGIPGHDVEDVALTNIRIETEEGGKSEWTERAIPEVAKAYPEARMFGRLPAYGLYCRHVTGLKLDNARLVSAAPDQRPALHCEEVKSLRVERLEATAPSNAQPLMRLVNVRDALVSGCSAPALRGAAVEVAGAESAGVRLVGNDFGRAAKALELKNGAAAGAVEERGNRTRRSEERRVGEEWR